MAAAKSPTTTPSISSVRFRDLWRLQRLFEHATLQHFGYFPAEIQQRVIRNHAIAPLVKAHLDPRRIILVARHGRDIVGYCIAAVPRTGPAQLFWLYVEPAHRGTNTGLSLLSRALKLMEAKGAQEVFLATYDHRRYYERQGFRFVRREPQDGVMLDIMRFSMRNHP